MTDHEEFERPTPPAAPELMFEAEFCLVQNCGARTERWFLHTQVGATAEDGSAYRKLIRLCSKHAFRPGEPIPGGMREMPKDDVERMWEAYGRFAGQMDVARRQGFMVVLKSFPGANILREKWKADCGPSRTAVFVAESGGDVWHVEWAPAVQAGNLSTPAGDSQKTIRKHVDQLYVDLAKDKPWGAGRMDMSEQGFRTPSITGFRQACLFALRVLDVESTIRDPEMLQVSLVSDS